MLFDFVSIALFINAIWLIIITAIFVRNSRQLATFTKGEEKKSVVNILSELKQDIDNSKKTIESLLVKYDRIEKEGQLHIQKIGLVRFNPFKETGGDQSFILSLLDGTNTGVVISGLYSRSGTRWFAKKVVKGKGQEHELSLEEQKAIQKAARIQEIDA